MTNNYSLNSLLPLYLNALQIAPDGLGIALFKFPSKEFRPVGSFPSPLQKSIDRTRKLYTVYILIVLFTGMFIITTTTPSLCSEDVNANVVQTLANTQMLRKHRTSHFCIKASAFPLQITIQLRLPQSPLQKETKSPLLLQHEDRHRRCSCRRLPCGHDRRHLPHLLHRRL